MPLAAKSCVSEAARDQLRRLDAAGLFGAPLADRDFAEAAKSGLFIYFECLEEAHTIAQAIESPTGSYWHGFLHRQEPDFSNAAYWFRRVKQHEIFPSLREAAMALAGGRASEILSGPVWDPFRFIDACERVRRRPDPALEQLLREVQRVEWQLLFDFCCRRAVGKAP